VAVSLGEITDQNREAVLAVRVAPGQERFVGSVRSALAEAAGYPHAKGVMSPMSTNSTPATGSGGGDRRGGDRRGGDR
jgi:hypothetical protein